MKLNSVIFFKVKLHLASLSLGLLPLSREYWVEGDKMTSLFALGGEGRSMVGTQLWWQKNAPTTTEQACGQVLSPRGVSVLREFGRESDESR